VIGSVLITHAAALDRQARRRVAESVRQAAPVVANLRNLSIAQARAATDVLTGLPNRRALDDTIKRMVAQASRAQLPLSALMLDLDRFKAANDELGHAKGDEILAAFGALLGASLRESDFAARYGGEEFMVLLPATGTAGALVIAEKLRAAVADLHIPNIDRAITTSVGVAVLPDHAIEAEGLTRAADRALYLAKTNGRNRIEVAAENPSHRLAAPGDAPADGAFDELLRPSNV
jgi:diguanylate cyclase (GGDEF)-like protein